MNLGLVGNCQFSALVDQKATVQWMCWPRFDSSCVFGSLIDEKCGDFQITTPLEHQIEQNYVQNTNILRTIYRSEKGEFEVIDFAPRYHQFDRVFSPRMLVRIVRPLKGEPLVKIRCQPTYDYGKMEPKTFWGSNHIQFDGYPSMVRLTTNAPLTYVQEERPFVLNTTRYFVLSWGRPLEAPLEDTCETFYRHTKNYWQTWVKNCSVPSRYQAEVIRSALVLKLHQYEDTGAITAASTTSLPESDGAGRNWDYRYCWLRDAYFTLSAFGYLGQFQEMEKFVEYLHNIAESADGNGGRLQPVYSISSDRDLTEKTLDHLRGYRGNQPVRIGNQAFEHVQNDIYGEMIHAISPLFLDRRFCHEETRPPKALLEKLLNQIDQTLEVPDAGIWEFRGREQIHAFSVLFHWLGAKTAKEISGLYRYQALLEKSETLLKRSRELMESRCWNEKLGCYVQAADSTELDASLFCLINLGFIDPVSERAKSHVDRLYEALRTDNGLIYRYVHNDDFGKPETTFTVCSFWYTEALARIGEHDRAKELFDVLVKNANHLGLLSEDIHPTTLEQWGNFPQTYSHVGLINAAFQIFPI